MKTNVAGACLYTASGTIVNKKQSLSRFEGFPFTLQSRLPINHKGNIETFKGNDRSRWGIQEETEKSRKSFPLKRSCQDSSERGNYLEVSTNG